eukprot:54714-Prorocentrum_lima.AAC.1
MHIYTCIQEVRAGRGRQPHYLGLPNMKGPPPGRGHKRPFLGQDGDRGAVVWLCEWTTLLAC